MKHHAHPPRRPAWWPENESWPPQRGRHPRSAFFRRMGCLFGLFNLVVMLVFLVMAGLVADALGWIESPLRAVNWIVPLIVLLVVIIVGMLMAVAFYLRRLALPLDGLLNASNRLAEGDYSARLEEERGPRQIRPLMRAFNSMASRLQAADQRRRDMLGDVTHELRTPLTVIQGEVEGMLDGVYPADEARLKSILEETQLLARLVDDLRTLALAEASALQLRCEPTDLAGLIRETLAAFKSTADAKRVRIELSLSDSPPLDVDPARIREVIGNLLTNALRYTPDGGVVRVEYDGSWISVTDSGPGVPLDSLPHLFDRFYKSSDSGGMGLGLSIAKYLVEAHGGAIRAENAAQGGMRITFTLVSS